MNSRRKFLKNASGLLATGFISNVALGNVSLNTKPLFKEGEIIYRTLGRTNIKIPVVNMGVMNASNPNLMKAAYQSGIRLFDTAWNYQGGNNEKMVGQVVRELNLNRSDVIIATKTLTDRELMKPGNEEALKKQFLERFNESLERLQMDYVDILYWHNLWDKSQVLNPAIKDSMQSLKEQGKIRFAGFSTHVYWPELLDAAAEDNFYDVVLLTFNYSMYNDAVSYDAMKKAVSKGIGLVAMKTQCQQDWYKENLPMEVQKFYEGTIMHSALLKWVLGHDFITTAIPGFTTFDQLQVDFKVAYGLDYLPEEKEFLENHNVKLAIQSVCRLCGECMPTCPRNVDLPTLMRTHMYASSYGNYYLARSTYSQIAQDQNLANCTDCAQCTAKCKNKVNIQKRLEELRMMVG